MKQRHVLFSVALVAVAAASAVAQSPFPCRATMMRMSVTGGGWADVEEITWRTIYRILYNCNGATGDTSHCGVCGFIALSRSDDGYTWSTITNGGLLTPSGNLPCNTINNSFDVSALTGPLDRTKWYRIGVAGATKNSDGECPEEVSSYQIRGIIIIEPNP